MTRSITTIAALALAASLAACADTPEDHLQEAEESRLEAIEEEREGDPVDAAEERAEMRDELEAAGAAADTVVP